MVDKHAINDSIALTEANSVDEFFCKLDSLTGEHGQKSVWLFRGHNDADWDLTPSAMRPTTKFPKAKFWPRCCNDEQVKAEFHVLLNFIRWCDLCGLPVPGDGMEFREYPSRSGQSEEWRKSGWPWAGEKLRVLAIAQHHRVPTRLLDFSRNWLAATFFAVEPLIDSIIELSNSNSGNDSARETKPAGSKFKEKLALWALDLSFIDFVRNNRAPSLTLAEVPTSENSFLWAQNGVFLYRKSGHECLEPETDYARMIENEWVFLGQKWLSESKLKNDARPVHKITLEKTPENCIELLEKLGKRGVSVSQLQPHYSSVVKAMKLQPKLGMLPGSDAFWSGILPESK